MNKKLLTLGLASTILLALSVCGSRVQKSSTASDIKVAMVTDQGGIDDKFFNQSAWEGLQK